MRAVSRFAVQVRASSAPLASPFGSAAERSEFKNDIIAGGDVTLSKWPSASEVGEGANPQRTANTLSVTANAVPALPEGEPRAPAALFHPLLPSVGVRWWDGGLGRCASIGPYETVEARTCTANRVFTRIPHPALRATFPPGEG